MSKAFLARTMVPTEATKVQNSSMLSGKRYNQETLSPFDITQYRGAGRAGALPALHHRAEEEEEAFSNHVHTSRAAMQPTAFLRKGEGLGGRSNAVLAVEAKEKRAVHRVAPVLHKPDQARLNPPNTELRKAYERGDLPCSIVQGAKNKLNWKVDLGTLDFHHYLPLFVSGLREAEEPYRFIAEEGSLNLIEAGGERKVLPVLPQLVLPFKDALATRQEKIIVRTLGVLKALAQLGTAVGTALVPFYRQILPPLSIYMGKGVNLGDGIHYGQRHGDFGERITSCLETLEVNGGPDALINIKYCLPLYESALMFQ